MRCLGLLFMVMIVLVSNVSGLVFDTAITSNLDDIEEQISTGGRTGSSEFELISAYEEASTVPRVKVTLTNPAKGATDILASRKKISVTLEIYERVATNSTTVK